MKILIILSTMLISCLNLTCSFAQDNNIDEWYPFVFPAKLDPNSPANIGKLVLDPPAGKHGFCKVKDGHFYFEDGTRAKFWGTNLCFDTCFPTHEEAVIIADRLAFFGFNAVRLHHMDFYFEPKGIFEDVCPAYKEPQMKETGHLSPRQMDKLDYLIYCLKQRGIYVDMNLLVSRHFTEADGVKDAAKLGMAAKPASMFDPKLIELQKKYAKDLLTHFNPYTKLRYIDDPTIALVEITNENSIITGWYYNQLNGSFFGLKKDSLPEFYQKFLDKAWNDWLKEKYGTLDSLKHSWFQNTRTELSPTLTSLNFTKESWDLTTYNKSTCNLLSKIPVYNLEIKRITAIPWHIQFCNKSPSLKKNANYVLRFSAKADRNREIAIIAQRNSQPWDHLGLSETIKLSDEFQSFSIPFTAKEDYKNTKIAFLLGQQTGRVSLKDINLEEINSDDYFELKSIDKFSLPRPVNKLQYVYPPQSIADVKEFYTDLEKKYFDDISGYLKKVVLVKVPITGMGGYVHPEHAKSQVGCDFIDTHTYWDHPYFPHKQWDTQDFTIDNKSLLLDKTLGIIGRVKSRKIAGKPFTISEWAHCYPNQYAYETVIPLAITAKDGDWDALFQFAFKHSLLNGTELNSINSYFDILSNSQQLILNSIASYIFIKSPEITSNINNGIFTFEGNPSGIVGFISNKELSYKSINISTNQNGAIIILNLEGNKHLLILLGEVKNKNSEWKNKIFNWGSSPVLLKDTKPNIKLPQTFILTPLNPSVENTDKKIKTPFYLISRTESGLKNVDE